MKTTLTVLLAAAIITAGGYAAFACASGATHATGDSHMSHMQGDMQGDSMPMNEAQVTVEQADAAVKSFLKSNFIGAQAGDTELAGIGMMDMSLYATSVTLADGAKGIVYTNPRTGEVMALAMGDIMDLMHSGMSGGHMSADGHHMMDTDSEDSGAGHTQHQH